MRDWRLKGGGGNFVLTLAGRVYRLFERAGEIQEVERTQPQGESRQGSREYSNSEGGGREGRRNEA